MILKKFYNTKRQSWIINKNYEIDYALDIDGYYAHERTI